MIGELVEPFEQLRQHYRHHATPALSPSCHPRNHCKSYWTITGQLKLFLYQTSEIIQAVYPVNHYSEINPTYHIMPTMNQFCQ